MSTIETKNKSIHGMNPQFLLEQILRTKIFQCPYWKEKCFALTSETIIDRAIELKYIGGTYGTGMLAPTDFICLIMKLLQIQPDNDIIQEYLNNTDYKYLRALAAFYVRLTNKSKDVFLKLEEHLTDYRKLRIRNIDGTFGIIHMDEYLDDLMTKESMFEISLPILTKRIVLEHNNEIQPRVSILEADLDLDIDLDEINMDTNLNTYNNNTLLSEDINNLPMDGNEDEYEESGSEEDGDGDTGLGGRQGRKFDDNHNDDNDDNSEGNKDNNEEEDDYKDNFEFLKKNRDQEEQDKINNKGRADRDSKWTKAEDINQFIDKDTIDKDTKDKDNDNDKFSNKKRNRDDNDNNNSYERQPRQGKVEEFSVEYWNIERAKLGLPLLPTGNNKSTPSNSSNTYNNFKDDRRHDKRDDRRDDKQYKSDKPNNKYDKYKDRHDDKYDKYKDRQDDRRENKPKAEDSKQKQGKVQEFSAEYWNIERAKLGLPLLPTGK